jgi:hypothetical protein
VELDDQMATTDAQEVEVESDDQMARRDAVAEPCVLPVLLQAVAAAQKEHRLWAVHLRSHVMHRATTPLEPTVVALVWCQPVLLAQRVHAEQVRHQ